MGKQPAISTSLLPDQERRSFGDPTFPLPGSHTHRDRSWPTFKKQSSPDGMNATTSWRQSHIHTAMFSFSHRTGMICLLAFLTFYHVSSVAAADSEYMDRLPSQNRGRLLCGGWTRLPLCLRCDSLELSLSHLFTVPRFILHKGDRWLFRSSVKYIFDTNVIMSGFVWKKERKKSYCHWFSEGSFVGDFGRCDFKWSESQSSSSSFI